MEKGIQKKKTIDNISKIIFLIITIICASVILVIVGIVAIKGLSPFFPSYENQVSFWDFITGMQWDPGTGYGVLFIVINTIYVVLLSLLLSVPVSVLTALFIVRIAPKKLGIILSSAVELLASIPSIIYGLFGAGIVTVGVRDLANLFGIQTYGGLSVLSTVIVLAMMIMPTITMISVTSIKAVKEDLVKGSLALGASPTQTNFKVVLKSAKSGIFSGIILGMGRALGEATAVSMVAGNIGLGPTFGIFDLTRTLTSTMLSGLSESHGLNYDIRFSVGIVLIVLILAMNLLLNYVKKKIGNR